ncbi:hypothetical protein PUATCC27989T_04065 [Phytobacter ursingii]|nr:hypothetical protein PUATCC27989T_04065 [Phytobacter ursingii]
MSYKDKIFTFWGTMDLLAIGSYLFYSLKMAHVPIWSDIQLFYTQLTLMEVRGADRIFLQFLFFIHSGLLLSLCFSAYAFLVKKKIRFLLIGLQEMMRILSLTCSVALFPLLLQVMRIEDAFVALILFVISETLKIGSLLWLRKRALLT